MKAALSACCGFLLCTAAVFGQQSSPGADWPRPEKVAPGNVRWHSDLKAARKAAEQSGRPVLLFQLLGNLDEQFT